jgi:hypothetical protein
MEQEEQLLGLFGFFLSRSLSGNLSMSNVGLTTQKVQNGDRKQKSAGRRERKKK